MTESNISRKVYITINSVFFIIVSLSISLIVASNGLFLDSKNYFLFASEVWAGLVTGIKSVYTSTGKFEPVTLLVFYFQKYIVDRNEFVFILVNYFLVSTLTLHSFYRFKKESSKQPQSIATSSLITMLLCLSFLTFSNNIYVWRTVFAVYFFIFATLENKSTTKKLAFFILSILSHQSVIIFYILYFISIRMPKQRVFNFIMVSVLISVVTYFILKYLHVFIGLFVSRGDLGIYLNTTGLAYQRILINLYCIFVLCLVYYISKGKVHDFWYFALFSLVLGLAFGNYWHIIWRVSLIGILVTLYIAISCFLNSKYIVNKLALLGLLSLSVLPTLRALYIMTIYGNYGHI